MRLTLLMVLYCERGDLFAPVRFCDTVEVVLWGVVSFDFALWLDTCVVLSW